MINLREQERKRVRPLLKPLSHEAKMQLRTGNPLPFNIYYRDGSIRFNKGLPVTEGMQELNIASLGYIVPEDIKTVEKSNFLDDKNSIGVSFLHDLFLSLRSKNQLERDYLQYATSYVRDLIDELEFMSLDILKLQYSFDFEEHWLYYHSVNSAYLAAAYCLLSDFPRQRTEDITLGALLHDLGHYKNDISLLASEEKKSIKQMVTYQQHPQSGYDLVKDAPVSDTVKQIILFHHEQYDDKGYPTQLPYDRLPEAPKIVAACETIESLLAPRPYRQSIPAADAISEMLVPINEKFQPDFLLRFLRLVGGRLNEGKPFYDIGQIILTNYNEVAEIKSHSERLLEPELNIYVEEKKQINTKPRHVKMIDNDLRYITRIFNKAKSEEIKKKLSEKLHIPLEKIFENYEPVDDNEGKSLDKDLFPPRKRYDYC